MLNFITGQRNSGKSRTAEMLALASSPSLLYVGTLPECDDTRDRIQAHRQRRGTEWSVYETYQPWGQTIIALDAMFHEHTGILLDGISSMFWLQVRMFSAGAPDLVRHCEELIGLAVKYSADHNLILVDCSVPFPKEGTGFWFNGLIARLHEELQSRSKDLS